MNILPKKSWHVRNKKNIERVRRDEEKAAEEEKERQRRIALAEQEARTDLLRERTRKRQHDQIEASSSSSTAAAAIEGSGESGGKLVRSSSADISLNQGGHFNFFKDIEEGLHREGKNKEHEAERAAEKEKWEKNIGLLTYLGQSAIESQNDKPWYLKKTEVDKASPKASPYDQKQSKREERDRKLKYFMDPLSEMKRHLEKPHKHKHHSKQKSGHPSHAKHSRHEQHPPSSTTKSTPTSSSSTPKRSKTMEELRAERLRREVAEKQKIATVMARAKGDNSSSDAADDHVSDADRDRSRGYNSRYNPDFVKPVSYRRR